MMVQEHGEVQCSAADSHVAVSTETACCFCLQFVAVPRTATAGSSHDVCTTYYHVALRLDTLAGVGSDSNVDVATS